ncbi:MAG TPA: hypothetical protein VGE21_12425, partial [Flavobacteriales bacterium]
CFGIPLSDGRLMLGQVIRFEREALMSVSCVLFEQYFASGSMAPTPDPESVVCAQYITPDLLDRGVWRTTANHPIAIPEELYPRKKPTSSGYIGATVEGSGIITHFANAFAGLAAWDSYLDPQYLDKLLIEPGKKPTHLLYEKDVPQ